MKVRIKKLNENAVVPQYAKDGDAGLDLTATSVKEEANGIVTYGTGLAFEIPKGYVGLVFPRSSNSKKTLLLSNSVGVIDSGYRGEVMLKFRKQQANESIIYQVGERVGQIIILPYPFVEFEVADTLSETERGSGGYGHTGI